MNPVVLVTAIGTAASTSIVSELKNNNCYVIGADVYQRNQVATAKDVDEFHVFPFATQDLDGYIDFVINFCKQYNVQYYFATIDEEVVNISLNRKRFEEIGVHLCIPNNEFVMTCHYKDKFFDWIKNNIPQVAVETYKDFDSIKDESFPLFIKPIEGRASIGCQKIENRNQLNKLIEKGINLEDYVLQSFLDGDVVTVDLVRNAEKNQMIQVQRKEVLRNSNGCGIAVEIINDDKLSGLCECLMEKLNLNGVANVEFFCKDNDYRIIEVNPRFSAGTSYSIMAGCNTPLNALRIAQGEDCIFGSIAYGRHLAKRYETYVLD